MSAQMALAPNPVLGCERSSDWSSSNTVLSTTSVSTEGTRALSVPTKGYTVLTSRTFAAPGGNPAQISLDLRLPGPQTDPYWNGVVELGLSSSSAGIASLPIGQLTLSGYAPGKYRTLTLKLPAAATQLLSGSAQDIRLRVVFNVPTEPGPYLLDNIRFDTVPSPEDYASVMAFESPTDFTATVPTAADSRHVDGQYGLRVSANGYAIVNSRPFAVGPLDVGTELAVQVYVPEVPANPGWYGDLEVRMSSMSAGLNSVSLGTRSLNGAGLGRFNEVRFALPSSVQSMIRSGVFDAQLQLALNVPTGSSPYVIDAAKFVEGVPTVSTLRLTHDGLSTAVHVVDDQVNPAEGSQIFMLRPLADHIAISADGVALEYHPVDQPGNVETLLEAVVPAGTRVVRVEYDQMDGALTFADGDYWLWFLNGPWAVGPRRVIIELPSDASLVAYYGEDQDPSPTRIVVDVPADSGMSTYAAYSTTVVPDLEDDIYTDHFELHMPSPWARYRDSVVSLLENAYAIFSEYSGQDINQEMGISRYYYLVVPDGYWGFGHEISGGTNTWGSGVGGGGIYLLRLGVQDPNWMVAVMLHELANGWWDLHKDRETAYDGTTWFDNEGHSGFLKWEASRDLGYCVDPTWEYGGGYADLQACGDKTATGCGSSVVLEALQQRFGWSPFRDVYSAVVSGRLRGMQPEQAGNESIYLFSRSVGYNLVPFFQSLSVPVSQDVQNRLAGLPTTTVPIPTEIPCRAPVLRHTPREAMLTERDAQGTASRPVYVCSPVPWTAELFGAPAGVTLRVGKVGDAPCGIVTVSAAASVAPGYAGALVLRSEGAIASPTEVPITVAAP